MKTTIYDKILAKGEAQVEKILDAAQKEAKKIEDDIVNKALINKEERLNKAKLEANKIINHQEKLLELEKRQAILIAKQQVIENIFNDVLKKVNNFEKDDLLKFVVKLIKKEETLGNETILVNEKDYDKYLKALSTNKKGDLVELDLLNKELKTNFKLSHKPVNIKDGFLLEGIDFDLNFSITNLVSELREANEKKISEQLFN